MSKWEHTFQLPSTSIHLLFPTCPRTALVASPPHWVNTSVGHSKIDRNNKERREKWLLLSAFCEGVLESRPVSFYGCIVTKPGLLTVSPEQATATNYFGHHQTSRLSPGAPCLPGKSIGVLYWFIQMYGTVLSISMTISLALADLTVA